MALNKTAKPISLNTAPAAATPAPTLQDHTDAPAADGDAPWEDAPPAVTAVRAPVTNPVQTTAAAGTPAVRQNAMAGMEGDGFGALDGEIGFGSFPIIKLDKDKFDVNGKEVEEFTCVMLSARDKWIHKVKEGDNEEIFYTYDGVVDTSNNSINDRYAGWMAAGFPVDEQGKLKVDVRKYVEVVVRMVDTEMAGTLALLSIPPASIKRLGGYRAEVNLAHKVSLSEVQTKCVKGAKVQVNPKISFYPWNFKFAGLDA